MSPGSGDNVIPDAADPRDERKSLSVALVCLSARFDDLLDDFS